MPGIRVKDHEPFESAMRRFKRVVEKAGTLADVRSRLHHEKKSAERKRLLAAAKKRSRKKTNFSSSDRNRKY